MNNVDKVDKSRFWLGAILAILGVVLMFTSLFLPPKGVIDSSALAACGEIFTLAGVLMGLGPYVDYRIRKATVMANKKDSNENNI